jgi:hypothetical protein
MKVRTKLVVIMPPKDNEQLLKWVENTALSVNDVYVELVQAVQKLETRVEVLEKKVKELGG